MKVLITPTSNQSGHPALCIAPLSAPLVDYLDYLIGQHAVLAKTVPQLVQFRTSKTHGLRLVHAGPGYKDLEKLVDDEDLVVQDLSKKTLRELVTMPTHVQDLVVYDDCIYLRGHARHDDDEYFSAPLEPAELRAWLAPAAEHGHRIPHRPNPVQPRRRRPLGPPRSAPRKHHRPPRRHRRCSQGNSSRPARAARLPSPTGATSTTATRPTRSRRPSS